MVDDGRLSASFFYQQEDNSSFVSILDWLRLSLLICEIAVSSVSSFLEKLLKGLE